MFKQRSHQKEMMDDLQLTNKELNCNLDELVWVNRWLGGESNLINALNKVYQKYHRAFERKITVIDLGCGGGDLLYAINHWAKKKSVTLDLEGIDANPIMIDYASKRFKLNNCNYQVADILKNFYQQADIFCLNSICHHFTEAEFIQLLQQLKNHTKLAIIINDLRRNGLAYFLAKYLTRFLRYSTLSKNDAPLSVLRSFRKHELIEIFTAAGINSYQITRKWAFRWQIIIWSSDAN